MSCETSRSPSRRRRSCSTTSRRPSPCSATPRARPRTTASRLLVAPSVGARAREETTTTGRRPSSPPSSRRRRRRVSCRRLRRRRRRRRRVSSRTRINRAFVVSRGHPFPSPPLDHRREREREEERESGLRRRRLKTRDGIPCACARATDRRRPKGRRPRAVEGGHDAARGRLPERLRQGRRPRDDVVHTDMVS